MVTPSGDGRDQASFNVENREFSNAFKCSRCGQNISLVSAQGIERVTQIIQDHLEQCLRSRSVQDISDSPLARYNINPLDLLMPLQPRRTWSAEDDRRRRLEADPDAYDVGPHTVTCRGCHRPIRLNATGRYYAANWNKHKMGCKIANGLDGGGSSSLESKFTGRVAAFRVANPTGEGSDSSLHSPTSIPASSSDSVSPHSPERVPRPPTENPEQRMQSTWRGQSFGHPRSHADYNPLDQQAIQRPVDLRISPADPYAQAQPSPFRSSTISPRVSSQDPQVYRSSPRHPALLPPIAGSTNFSISQYENERHRAPTGALSSRSHSSDTSGAPRVENLLLTSGFEARTIRRDHRDPGFANQLTGHDSRGLRDDSRRVGLPPSCATHSARVMTASSHTLHLQTPIRGVSTSASNFRSSDPTITDSSSSSASSSPVPAATTLERSKRQHSSSGNFTHHSAASMPSYQVGNRLQASGGLENRPGLGSPHYRDPSAHIPTRFASNEPPFPDSRTSSSSAMSSTLSSSSSASMPRGGSDSGQMLPSLNSLTRTLPHPGRLIDADALRGVPRSSNTGSQDRFRSSPAPENSPRNSSLILPPIRMPPPGTSSFNKRQFDNETAIDRDWPSPKKSSTPLGGHSSNREPFQFRSGQSAAPNQRFGGQSSVSSSPKFDNVNLGRSTLRNISGPSAPLIPAPQTLMEGNKEQHAARLHPVWKWEKGKVVDPDPEQRPRISDDTDGDDLDEMNHS